MKKIALMILRIIALLAVFISGCGTPNTGQRTSCTMRMRCLIWAAVTCRGQGSEEKEAIARSLEVILKECVT